MEVFAERRRNPGTGGLRRSRSVRASLRMIGNKWKGHKPNEEVRLDRSLSDTDETDDPEIFARVIKNDELYSNFNWNPGYKDTDELIYTELEVKKLTRTPIMPRKNQPVEEKSELKPLLRASTDRINKLEKRDKFSDIFSRGSKQKENAPLKRDVVFQIPAAVPPKAAAILHIPTEEMESFDLNRHRYLDNAVEGFGVAGSWVRRETGPPLGSSPIAPRMRRGSEGDQGIVNPSFQNTSGPSKQVFAFYSPPKDRKSSIWTSHNQLKLPIIEGDASDGGHTHLVSTSLPQSHQHVPYSLHLHSNNYQTQQKNHQHPQNDHPHQPQQPAINRPLQQTISTHTQNNNNNNQQNDLQQIHYQTSVTNPPQITGKLSKKQSKQVQAQQEKLAQINIHLHALFAAVEHGHMEKARTILESTDVDVNSLNADGLSPLDVAVLSNNRPLAKMLLGFGAQEGNHMKSSDALGSHLRRLSSEAECRLQEMSSFRSGMGGSGSNYSVSSSAGMGGGAGVAPVPRSQGGGTSAGGNTGCAGQSVDQEKQLHHWERRTKALRRMVLGWQQMRAPGLPCSPELDVTTPTSVTVRIRENIAHHQSHPIITKYKVQWSSRADFSNVCGEKEVRASLPSCSCVAGGLTRGRRYFFRAQGGNLKGWGPHNTSTPNSVLPSSWRDVEGRRARWDGAAAAALERVAASARLVRPARAIPPPPRRAMRGRHAIRHLFTAASKFHKNLRRGVYLACIIYHEDKVLVTNEDFLPVIEIDETYPACIYTDYHWLMKVACTWDDVKSLRSDMEKNSSSAIHFRTKLLAAAAQMQSALCIQDLGQLYHKPLRDSHGTLVISCINSVKSAKSVSVLNSRWLPLNKVHKRITALSEDNTIGDLLMATIHDQINYHQLSSVKLPRGLYLGYLKLQSSVDLIQVVVPAKAPNVLPHCKMRDNSHVSAEEWDFLKQQQSKALRVVENTIKNTRRMSITSIQSQSPTESQQMFLDLLTSSAKKLFKYMDIPLEKALTHRLYDLEVLDLSNDVSFIIICPPAEQACSVPGQREILLQRGDLLSLPIQAFEMIHLNTYQNSIINKYSRLSCTLELDTVLANHSHREAFSNSELQTAKDRLAKLQELQNNLNTVWKDCRWLMDVISFARDKDKLQGGTGNNNIGIQMKNLISRIPTTLISHDNNPVADNLMVNSNSNSNLKRTLLQIPPRDQKLAKSSPGRGSWPGPNATSPLGPPGNSLLSAEFSKSEQHLSITPREDSVSTLNLSGSQYLSATSDALSVMDPYSRKSSADSQFTHSSITSNNFFPSNNNQQVQTKVFEEPTIINRLPPSRSQDTLLSQPNVTSQRRKSAALNSSLSATSSPLLHVKPFYAGSLVSVNTVNTTNTSDSMHSISSDSEGQSFPISTSTPNKIKTKKSKTKKHESSIASSKSMSNVKCSLDFSDTGQNTMFLKPTTYLKPTLNAIQCESEFEQNLEDDATFNASNDTKIFFLDKPRIGHTLEIKNNETQRSCDTRKNDERHDSPQKDLKSCEKQAPLSQTKILLQQSNEASDIASSSDGSRYSSHGSLSHQSVTSDQLTVKNSSPGILQVYAAYDTGLATGTSLKLHVTPRTSAREVVDLVVKQLNMAVVLKGKDGPIYTNDKLQNFCLVAVIGARERCLRDDFKPLQLQNPWRKGRLYVRQKHEVLAALEHSSKRAAFI